MEEAIRSFARHSPLNRMPTPDGGVIFDEPLVQFADGDDPIFTEYKTIIDPTHLTPREALAKTCNKNPEDVAQRLSVISWVLPITNKTRGSNRRRKKTPSRLWTYTRWYGEKFNDALREHVTNLLTEKGYLATAPMIQPYYERTLQAEGKSYFSNWSERHIAYAAGLGTFSLSDGFITERGIAHRCGSVVTDMLLPPSRRTAEIPYANCLFYANHSCQACINRCPAGAITEKGHDKLKCHDYLRSNRRDLSDEFKQVYAGCGLCQTRVPCEASNPVGKIKKRLQNI
ncbi:MAG: hypothetical protein A2144_00690 [Chloroflexi bacterium RBG_16_50_9]|nr:MAG: hypothetical protein A2144_00690 [Chloroflexi bacterium RBG_16_50_9]